MKTNTNNSISLYEIFRKIPEVTHEQVKMAAETIPYRAELANRSDLLALEFRLVKWMIALNLTGVGIILAFLSLP